MQNFVCRIISNKRKYDRVTPIPKIYDDYQSGSGCTTAMQLWHLNAGLDALRTLYVLDLSNNKQQILY